MTKMIMTHKETKENGEVYQCLNLATRQFSMLIITRNMLPTPVPTTLNITIEEIE